MSHDPQPQGNWGNALLEHGQVKRRLLAEVEAAASALGPDAQEDPRAAAAIAAADASLRAEAEGLLLAAGKRFRGVLEIRGEDVRALTYWGAWGTCHFIGAYKTSCT